MRSNSYFELKSPEEYKQLSVALTLANAKLEDMYMMKEHADFQILQNRIQEQLNTTEALRQIKENELTLNPQVITYLFNGPSLAQQQAQQNLQQIQNGGPVGIPAIAPIEEQKADPPDGEQKGEQDDVVNEDEDLEDNNKNAEKINNDFIGQDLDKLLEELEVKLKEVSRGELKEDIEEAEQKLKVRGISEIAKVYYRNLISSAQMELQEREGNRPKAEEDEDEGKDEGEDLTNFDRERLVRMVKEKLGKVKYIGQTNYGKKNVLIKILAENMNREEAEEYMTVVKKEWDERKGDKKMNREFEEIQRKQELKDLIPDVKKKVKQGKQGLKIKKKVAGEGLKYKKTPKELLMLGSAHAGNNNKKMIRILRNRR